MTHDAIPPAPADEPRRLRDRLVRLAYRFVWNQHDAEDIAQDALATALEKAERLRDPAKRTAWLFSIVVQRCRAHGRKIRLWRKHEEPYRTAVFGNNRQATDDRTEEDRARVRALLPELPQRQREVIILHHLQGLSFEDVAQVLGISAATARVHAHVARETLRCRLFDEANDYETLADDESERTI